MIGSSSRSKLKIASLVFGVLTVLCSLPYLSYAFTTITADAMPSHHGEAGMALGIALVVPLGLLVCTAILAWLGRSKAAAALAVCGLFAEVFFILTVTLTAPRDPSPEVQADRTFVCGSARNSTGDDAVEYAISVPLEGDLDTVHGELRHGDDRWTFDETACQETPQRTTACEFGEGWAIALLVNFEAAPGVEPARPGERNHHFLEITPPRAQAGSLGTFIGSGALSPSCDSGDVRAAEASSDALFGRRPLFRVWYQAL